MLRKNGTSEEDLDSEGERWECHVRRKPVKGQSPVFTGIGLLGEKNSVVLIVASTFKGGGTASGWAAQADVVEHMAGASLHHVPGCEKCVSTADHCLEGCIEDFVEKMYWQMEIWAMPAAQFQDLDETDKWDLHVLREKGAVKAEGYFSLAQDRKFRNEVNGRPDGLDVAVVKFLGPLTGLSAAPNQPRILFRKEAGHASAYFNQMAARKVVILLEGTGWTGSHASEHEKKKRNSKRLQKKAVTSVRWTKLKQERWTRTSITGMAPQQFGVAIYLATWFLLPLRYAGILKIYQAYVPKGFSGGGAYTVLPARALNPDALATDAVLEIILFCRSIYILPRSSACQPRLGFERSTLFDLSDVPILLGNIATWHFCSFDSFPSKVIYGPRSWRTLSGICFLFSSWFTDVQEGVFKDVGDEVKEEDTPFWLTKQFISIILLDRRNDDVLLVEGEGSGGGDVEVSLEEGIYRTLSVICFFFSSLFTDVKGNFKDRGDEDEDEDEDIQVWLFKILISIILLDIHHHDVLSLEDGGGGGGDLEVEGIYKMLSTLCFFFSCLFTDIIFSLFANFKEGKFEHSGDEDQDTQFGLIKFLLSIILLDRRGSYDDVLKIEGEAGGGGDVEENCIHSINVALLTREGLAQQMGGHFYRL